MKRRIDSTQNPAPSWWRRQSHPATSSETNPACIALFQQFHPAESVRHGPDGAIWTAPMSKATSTWTRRWCCTDQTICDIESLELCIVVFISSPIIHVTLADTDTDLGENGSQEPWDVGTRLKVKQLRSHSTRRSSSDT